jgi:hypothetical protein
LDVKLLHSYFKEECSLTGDIEEITIDHFIPISWGHGGTYIGNVYPLNITINRSKKDLNPFKWFEWAKDKYEINIHKWNNLIEKLAIMNGLSVMEFKDFIYWCERNKRTIEEIQKENIPSIVIWKKANKD